MLNCGFESLLCAEQQRTRIERIRIKFMTGNHAQIIKCCCCSTQGLESSTNEKCKLAVFSDGTSFLRKRKSERTAFNIFAT